MKIIAFLGNPGRKYVKTRHNIGFIIGEYFAREFDIKVKQKNFSSVTGTGRVKGEDVCLLFPQTFMNNSGNAVQQALAYYREETSNLIAVHDEIEFKFERFEAKFGGGHKGHNGLRSIIQQTGSADFHRLRFGVGRPDNPEFSVADYVLGNFSSEEQARVEVLMPEIVDLLLELIEKE